MEFARNRRLALFRFAGRTDNSCDLRFAGDWQFGIRDPSPWSET